MAELINGKELAAVVIDEVANDVQVLKKEFDKTPTLVVVLVGEDAASQVYVRNKIRVAKEAGINSVEHSLSVNVEQVELNAVIDSLNCDDDLPAHLNEDDIIKRINPDKDVDGFHPLNVDAWWCRSNDDSLFDEKHSDGGAFSVG